MAKSWKALAGGGANAVINAIEKNPIANEMIFVGNMTSVGGVSCTRVAKYDGTSSSSLGAGISFAAWSCALDSAGNLYVAGNGVTVRKRTVGGTWSDLSGFSGATRKVVVKSDDVVYIGKGSSSSAANFAYYNGTTITYIYGFEESGYACWDMLFSPSSNKLYGLAGGTSSGTIKYWNGETSWTQIYNQGVTTRAFTIATNGDVYVSFNATSVGGVSANYIAKWNGSAWSALGSGLSTICNRIKWHNGKLYCVLTGTGSGRFKVWDGSSWETLSSNFNGEVYDFNWDADDKLFAVGAFTTVDGVTVNYIAEYSEDLSITPSPDTHSFGTVYVNQPSSPVEITATVAGTATNMSVEALTGFEYSSTEAGTYTSTLSLGTVTDSTATFWIRCNSASAGSLSGNVTITCDEEVDGLVAVTATVSLPVIVATPDAVVCNGYANIRTDAETFSLSVTGLATNCELDCSADPEVYISLDGNTWTNTIDLDTLEDESVTVYVSILSNLDITSATISFTCDEGSTETIDVSATIAWEYTRTPASISYGNVESGNSKDAEVVITATEGNFPEINLSFDTDDQFVFVVDGVESYTQTFALNMGSSKTITVRFNAGTVNTLFSNTMNIDVDDYVDEGEVALSGNTITILLSIYELLDSHIRDRMFLKDNFTVYSSAFTVYEKVESGTGAYNYSTTTGIFEPVANGDYDAVAYFDISVPDIDNEIDVDAEIRTIEVLQNNDFTRGIALARVNLKTSINRQILADGTETQMKQTVFHENFNVMDNEDNVSIKLYKYLEDVNDETTLTAGSKNARLNGLRNFIIPDIPSVSNLTKSVSLRYKLTNEGKIFDIKLIIVPRMELNDAT